MDHGIDLSNKYFLAWTIGVPVSYFFFVITFRGLGLWKEPTRRGSRASDIMVFSYINHWIQIDIDLTNAT